MTAAGLDHVSDGRFVLGLGASGPQVVEGFHGVPYKQPLGRTREVVEICRRVWRREALDFHGDHFDVPLRPEDGGSGLGKPLKLINQRVRDRIPIRPGRARPQERRPRRRGRRGLGADLLPPRGRRRGLRRGARGGQCPPPGRHGPAAGRRRHPWSGVRGPDEIAAPRSAPAAAHRPVRRGHGRARQELLPRPRPPGSASARRPTPSRTSSSAVGRPRPSPPCPTRCCTA